MKVTILGSGTYQPLEVQRHSAAYLVQDGNKNLVFDFGRGVVDQLLKCGVAYYDIDTIFLTHTHPDHCAELGAFLFASFCGPSAEKYKKKLVIYGPQGIKSMIKHLLAAFSLSPKLQNKFKVKELRDGEMIKVHGFQIEVYTAKHSKDRNCLCYRVGLKNKILAYSGDGGDSPGLRKACYKADLAMIEANGPKKIAGHMTARDVSRLAHAAQVKKLVLTHFLLQDWKGIDMRKETEVFFKGPILLARDLMKINV